MDHLWCLHTDAEDWMNNKELGDITFRHMEEANNKIAELKREVIDLQAEIADLTEFGVDLAVYELALEQAAKARVERRTQQIKNARLQVEITELKDKLESLKLQNDLLRANMPTTLIPEEKNSHKQPCRRHDDIMGLAFNYKCTCEGSPKVSAVAKCQYMETDCSYGPATPCERVLLEDGKCPKHGKYVT